MSRLATALCAALSLLLASASGPRAEEAITVFGAASLSNALGEIAELYRQETGRIVRLSFASSSTLARQIESGAPAQIYASAAEGWMDYVEERGLIDPGSRISPIGNRLVLIVPDDSPLQSLDISPDLDLLALLGEDGRIAVGEPAHVPAGIYARQALESLGFWAAAEPRLARAENVRSALVLVELGETPLGIVYDTDAAISDKVRIVGVFPRDSHAPVTYPFAIVSGQASPAVTELFAWITGEAGLAIFARYGFVVRDGG